MIALGYDNYIHKYTILIQKFGHECVFDLMNNGMTCQYPPI